MRIVSWNVNGLRACAKKGFLGALARSEADVVGIREMKTFESQLPDEARPPRHSMAGISMMRVDVIALGQLPHRRDVFRFIGRESDA